MKIALTAALTATLCIVTLRPANAAGPAAKTPTFTRDVAPIFHKNCVSCHRQGEIAPMPLLTYKDARPWVKAIREKAVSREMPPWHADPKHGQWSNDRRLAAKDIETIAAWADGGAPEGNVKDLPPAPKFASGWQMGEPDVVFQMPKEYKVPASGTIPYQHFTVPTNFTEDRYIVGLEARAGNLAVVHHIVIYVNEPGAQRPKRTDFGTNMLGALSPGMTPFRAAAGTAKRIRAGANLVFQMHYTANGTEALDRSSVGLIFAKGPVDRAVTTSGAFDSKFTIPPGADNYEVRATYEFEEDSTIWSFMPHMHLRGKDFLFRATYPDGRSEILLSVPNYNFAWQVYYYPLKPLQMPKGTKIEGVAHFDNSAGNPRNPDPAKAVRFGQQTWEEMMNGFFDYTVDSENVRQPKPSSAGTGGK